MRSLRSAFPLWLRRWGWRTAAVSALATLTNCYAAHGLGDRYEYAYYSGKAHCSSREPFWLSFYSWVTPEPAYVIPDEFVGYDDAKVIGYRFRPDTTDTKRLKKFYAAPACQELLAQQLQMPDGIELPGCRTQLDESEITNEEWRTFQTQLARDSSTAAAGRYEPLATALPRPDYFTSPFYRYFPVVGVSYEQVLGYCRWRSTVVTQFFNVGHRSPTDAPKMRSVRIVARYRLPTEQEWEQAAAPIADLPYGTRVTEAEVRIHPQAAEYLQLRSGTSKSVEEVARDIAAWNEQKPVIPVIVCRRDLPYFLQAETPLYVHELHYNYLGFTQMLGNVAELVQEKGITKGGSYRDRLEDCQVTKRGAYTGPAPTIGFRCAVELTVVPAP